MKKRVCTKCGTEYPLDKEHFRAHPRYKEGFKRQCNWCSYTPEYGRKKQMERRYGLTVEQYEEKLAAQGGHCALCPAVQGTHKRRLTVDHDHCCCDQEKACGKCNRGILCADCNRKVGFLEAVLREALVIPKAGTLKTLGNPETWTSLALQYLTQYAAK